MSVMRFAVSELAGTIGAPLMTMPPNTSRIENRRVNEHNRSGESTVDLASFEARAVQSRRKPLAAGELLSLPEYQRWFEQNQDAVDSLIASSAVFHVELDGVEYVPAFSSCDGTSLLWLQRIGLLGSVPGWAQLHFLTAGRGSLGGSTPLHLGGWRFRRRVSRRRGVREAMDGRDARTRSA